ncbi:MAG: hypothetical protein LBE77_08735, partial [Fluviicola sp.]|nr:hypothetical protein [Fluviicola sp.]
MKKNSYLLLFTALLSFITGTIIAQENIISENGNIGLGTGTTAPTSRLTVAGSARIDSALVVNDSVSIAASARVGEDLKVEGNLYLPNIPVLSIYKDEAILFTNAEGMTSKADINLLKSLIYAEPVSAQPLDFCEMAGYMDHPTWANGPNKLYSACPQVFIGVGTANPAFPLDVNGSAKVSSHLWANGSLSVGADVNPFSKLNVVNTNRPAAIQVSTVGNPKPYQRLMFFE